MLTLGWQWKTGCRLNCRQSNKKSWWNHCTMWRVCCWKGKISKSSSSTSICTRAWDGLWLNPWRYNASILSGFVSFASNGWGSNQGISLCIFYSMVTLFLLPCHDGYLILYYKGSFLIAEVMAMKGYKVQPLPRVPRHDTVQVGFSTLNSEWTITSTFDLYYSFFLSPYPIIFIWCCVFNFIPMWWYGWY